MKSKNVKSKVEHSSSLKMDLVKRYVPILVVVLAVIGILLFLNVREDAIAGEAIRKMQTSVKASIPVVVSVVNVTIPIGGYKILDDGSVFFTQKTYTQKVNSVDLKSFVVPENLGCSCSGCGSQCSCTHSGCPRDCEPCPVPDPSGKLSNPGDFIS